MTEPTTRSLHSLGEYRHLFPIASHSAYMNHASIGPLSTRVISAMTQGLEWAAEGGSDSMEGWNLAAERTRGKMAQLIGADADELAMVQHTPAGLGIVAAGLPWASGDTIITCDQEFPANMYPWLGLQADGVLVNVVSSDPGWSIPTQRILDAIDSHTRLVSLSWVEFLTGYRHDLRTISDACHEVGAFLVVDAMQGLGALRCDVRRLGVDFLATASHKWIMAPPTIGWLFVRKELLDTLQVTTWGWGNQDRSQNPSYLDYGLPLWESARRYESGIPNFTLLPGVEAAIDLLLEVGTERIENQIRHLTDLLDQHLSRLGIKVLSDRTPDHWSGCLTVDLGPDRSKAIHERLAKAGVVCSLRESLVRFSPHFYNSDDDVYLAISVLEDVLS